MTKHTEVIVFRASPGDHESLKQLADRVGVSKPALLRHALTLLFLEAKSGALHLGVREDANLEGGGRSVG